MKSVEEPLTVNDWFIHYLQSISLAKKNPKADELCQTKARGPWAVGGCVGAKREVKERSQQNRRQSRKSKGKESSHFITVFISTQATKNKHEKRSHSQGIYCSSSSFIF